MKNIKMYKTISVIGFCQLPITDINKKLNGLVFMVFSNFEKPVDFT